MGDNGLVSYEAASPSDIPQFGGADLFAVSASGAITTTAAAVNLVWPDDDRFSFTVRAYDNPNVQEDEHESKSWCGSARTERDCCYLKHRSIC